MIHTVHHTSSKKNGEQYVIDNLPFLSEHDPKAKKTPFLGEGYYFWDFNQMYAEKWGKLHYRNSFYVSEAEVLIPDEDIYLDLAGNRKHMHGFLNLLAKFNLVHKEGTGGIDLNYIIEELKEAGAFPWRIIRALDYKDYLSDEGGGIKTVFRKGNGSYVLLNPRIIICYIKSEEIQYKTKPFTTFVS